ncbi:MAG: P-type conjugative transfer protein TrbL [Acidimicrobiia bacterium]|nr:P-type conjugative transfer protein TrbL [Acidimicrobiia bacterium]
MANSLVAQFQAAIAGIYGAILPIAQNLFIFLAAIHITWALIWWVIEKDDPVPLFVSLLKNLMRIAFFWFVLLNANTLSQTVITSFRLAGQAAASAAGSPTASLDPAAMVGTGADLADQLLSNVNVAGILGTIAGALIGGILALVMFVAFLFIAAQMAIALVEAFIILGAGVLLLGFLGSPWTAGFGMTYFGALVGSGVKLFLIYIIAGIGSALVPGWSAFLAGGVTFGGALTVLGAATIFALATWMIPNYSQALSSGAVTSSLHTAVSATAGFAATAAGLRVPLALGARASAALGQGAGIARDRYRAGAGAARALGAGVGQTALSPFRAAGHNLATRNPHHRMTAADALRRKRGL